LRNMLTGVNPARAGEDSYGKSEAIMIPPKGTGPLLKQRLWLYFCSRVIWNDNDQMYMYRQSRKCTDYYRLCPFHSFFSISLVIENSRSAVSGEQPKLETNSFSSVLSGFVI